MQIYLSLRMRKTTIWVSDQVRHKSACIVREEGLKPGISGLEELDISM